MHLWTYAFRMKSYIFLFSETFYLSKEWKSTYICFDKRKLFAMANACWLYFGLAINDNDCFYKNILSLLVILGYCFLFFTFKLLWFSIKYNRKGYANIRNTEWRVVACLKLGDHIIFIIFSISSLFPLISNFLFVCTLCHITFHFGYFSVLVWMYFFIFLVSQHTAQLSDLFESCNNFFFLSPVIAEYVVWVPLVFY